MGPRRDREKSRARRRAGRVSERDRTSTLERISPAARWADFDVDVAIEAATENEALERETFERLDAHTPDQTVLASNTSSLSITKLAGVTRRPESVVGMHYINPVPAMQLVEIVRGIATSQQTFDAIRALALRQGKTPVEVGAIPGSSRTAFSARCSDEAMFALFEGVGTVERSIQP